MTFPYYSVFHLEPDLPPKEISCSFPIVLLIRSIQPINSSLGAHRREWLLTASVLVGKYAINSRCQRVSNMPLLFFACHSGGFKVSSVHVSEKENSFLNYDLWNIKKSGTV